MASGWLIIMLAAIAIAAVDIRLMLIPDELTAVLAAVGLAFMVLNVGYAPSMPYHDSFLGNYASLFPVFASSIVNHLAGAVLGAGLLGALLLASRGRAMGMGDVKLAGAMGLILGLPDIFFALALSFVAGGAWSAYLLLFRRAALSSGAKTMVPFGPFLILGLFAHVFFGHALFAWYFSLL
jgi:leader peptidase (prepilin peptidase)/N-methyltransferase